MLAETLKAPVQNRVELGMFWSRYFKEIPTCTSEGCAEVAVEVDPFFPYLDDRNRCQGHQETPAGPSIS